MKRRSNGMWLPSVVAGITIFLFFFSLLVLALFLLGNLQNFLDSTQSMLLRIFEISSLLYVVSALYYVVLDIILAIRKKRRLHPVSMVLSIAGAALVFGTYLFFGFLITWLNPLN